MDEQEFYVGKTVLARFKLEGVNPLTLKLEPVLGADPISVSVERGDGTELLALDRAGGGVEELGQGYYFCTFDPDAAGIHKVRIRARSPDGHNARDVIELYVQDFEEGE